MKKELITPLGVIRIYVDNILFLYDCEPYSKDIKNGLAGCYRIVISQKEWQTIRCVLVPFDDKIQESCETGERYFCSHFVKDGVILTIGAGDDIPEFDTKQIPHGIEYIRKKPVNKVTFGIAWAIDYDGQDDIRTYLATDLY